MEILKMFDLSAAQWIWIILAAILVGLSKTGISAFSMLVIPILASVFGGKDSTGIMLPMLIVGDIFAVWYYHRHAEWGNIKRLLPWVLAGLAAGVVTGNLINDRQFKMLIGIMVLFCVAILVYNEIKRDNVKVPESPWFYILIGASCGFASMIGNAAGPIFAIYLLAMGFKKHNFMGTTAWFFLIINITKVPLQIFVWHNITLKTFVLTCAMIPAITAGALLGIFIIKKLNEKLFRHMIIAVTVIAALRLFL